MATEAEGYFFLGAATAGDDVCPVGTSAVSKASCYAASNSAGVAVGRSQATSGVLTEGGWSHTPPGCFIHAEEGKGVLPHFSTGAGSNNGDYQIVCFRGAFSAKALLALTLVVVWPRCRC